MQKFQCPFCGLREEREFRYVAESGKVRPDTTEEVSAADWAKYLYGQNNPIGDTSEIWVHLPCQEYFVMQRDTVTMDVSDSKPLRIDNP